MDVVHPTNKVQISIGCFENEFKRYQISRRYVWGRNFWWRWDRSGKRMRGRGRGRGGGWKRGNEMCAR